MNKPEYVHWEPVHLTRSMSPRTKREFNNTSIDELNKFKETSDQLAKKAIDRMDYHIYCYLCANLFNQRLYYKGDNESQS